MATTQSQGIDRIISPPIEDRPTDPDNLMEKPLQVKNDRPSSLIPSVDSGMGLSMNSASQVGSFSPAIDHSSYTPNLCSPQAQAIYYKGSETAGGEWDVYPSYVNAERLDVGSPGIYNENPSVMYHTGYGFSQQVPYGPYSPATTPLPSVGNDAQLYSPQQYSFSGQPYYQQIVPPSMQYVGPPTPVSQPMLNTMVGIDQHVEGMHFGSRPNYPTASFGRGDFSGSPISPSFNDFHQGFDAFGVGGLWSNWQKPSERQRAPAPFSPAVSPQPTSNLGSFGQHIGMPSQQPRSFYGVGSGSDTYNRGYLHTDFGQGSKFGAASVSSMLTNDRSWLAFDYRTQRGKVNSLLCNCNDTLNILNEQNRGPRASKSKSQIANENSPSAEGNNYNSSVSKTSDDAYNHLEFLTEYEDAKFFVIKSYTEDNVHKSIKYGIWASTPNGNRKLDSAYLEAKDKLSPCPVFLLFSVNASAQFCGVAEMVGPVDFEKSVDYWQQDKWSGQFPVKWHIIKDVPNSQFRHIVLENNESKPVTNSRDTQEVKLDQGIEMLKIFKNYESDVSILDDFEFYEDRQKAMQERKARQQSSLVGIGVAEGNEDRNFVSVPNNFIKQMSKSFAEVVRVDDSVKDVSAAERGGVEPDGSLNNRVKVEEASSVVSPTQTS